MDNSHHSNSAPTDIYERVEKWVLDEPGYKFHSCCSRWIGTDPYPEAVVLKWQSSVPRTESPLYTGLPLEKEMLVASASPVGFQCANKQIITGSPLGQHWVLTLGSLVPVASQCTCGSSAFQCVPLMQMSLGLSLGDRWVIQSASVLPVKSAQWYRRVLRASGLEVNRPGHTYV